MACSERELALEFPQATSKTTTTPSAPPIISVRIAPEPPLRSGSDGQPVRDDVHIPARIRLVPTRPKLEGERAHANRARWRFDGGAGTPLAVGLPRAPVTRSSGAPGPGTRGL